MFAKLFIVFACLSVIMAAPAPEPKAEAKPEPEPYVVSTYNAGLPIVNTYSAPLTYSSGYPFTYSASPLTYSAGYGNVFDNLHSTYVV